MELTEGKYKVVYTITNGETIPRTQKDENTTTDEKNEKTIDLNTDDPAHNSHGISTGRSTTYTESLMHLLKGNVGSGVFAMGDAFKNAGLIVSPICTIILGIVCVHSQHILLKCSRKMKEKLQLKRYPDFAETVELCFQYGPTKLQKYSIFIKHLVNMFLCLTQLGFCCVYIVFIATNCKQILDHYDFEIDLHLHMVMILLPILLLSLIPNLKLLAPCSTIANVCMGTGIGVVFYYALQDMPSITERNYVGELANFPLYFGTAIYAFEGIALVLPLKNSMKRKEYFNNSFGVLNVGMIFVTFLYTLFGFFGYLKWGDDVEGSLTLNLPPSDILAQIVKLMVSFGMLLTYPLQFYVAAQILWSYVNRNYGPFNKHALKLQLIFRALLVLGTFAIAELVPQLNVFISLIGALCSTALALVFPPLVQLIITWSISEKPNKILLVKNITILFFALFGFMTGTYESLTKIIETFFK